MPTYTLNGDPLPIGPFTVGEGEAAVVHPVNVLEQWSDEELAAIGVERIPDPPAPEAGRRMIAKSVVQERVNDIGKLGDAFAALNSQPIMFARWFAPDWPNVFADDEGLLALLTGIGCNEAQIAVITA